MAGDVVVSLYTRNTSNSRLMAFQQEVMGRYLPKGIDFRQLDMQSVVDEMEEPPWAQSYGILSGDRFSSSFHAKCLDKCLYSLPYDHFIILDIDAVPLSSAFFDFMLSNRHWLVGAAHAANHLRDPEKFIPYVSPAAMSISKQTYCSLQESFAPDRTKTEFYDSGVWLTVAAQKLGIPNVLLYPTDYVIPRWRVGWATYGMITNYANLLCHMWCSRAVGAQSCQQYITFCRERMQDAVAVASSPSETARAKRIHANTLSTGNNGGNGDTHTALKTASLTYVMTTLFRGDDIEQVEYVIGQLIALSAQPRQILVFNGGRYPRQQDWLERKYPHVRVLEPVVPDDWVLRSERHYYNFVCTQLHKYVETEYYLKMDRDVCVLARGCDRILVDFMRQRPDVAAAGVRSLVDMPHKLALDERNLLKDLPHPVSYHETHVLNGGVELFRTSSMNEIGPIVDEYAKCLWRDRYLDLAEDDLTSFVLQGMGFEIQDCPSIGTFRGELLPEPDCTVDMLGDLASYLYATDNEFCIVHGFKPFARYRSFYRNMHSLLGRKDSIMARNEANSWDRRVQGHSPCRAIP